MATQPKIMEGRHIQYLYITILIYFYLYTNFQSGYRNRHLSKIGVYCLFKNHGLKIALDLSAGCQI